MSQDNRYIYRIKYTKGDEVKYISHLDFLRSINRSFKRARIPVKYSNGFNPHVLLNIALPCPVGVSSECELLDIELKCPMDKELIATQLSSALPVGIRVLEVWKNEGLRDFYDIAYASYEISFKSDKGIDIEEFSALSEFMIEKKSKRGMKEVNIKDFVKDISLIASDGDSYTLSATISAGQKSNLKSELLLNAIQSCFGAKFTDIKQKRCEIFFE